jgi:hypothetical protein
VRNFEITPGAKNGKENITPFTGVARQGRRSGLYTLRSVGYVKRDSKG